MHFLMSKGRPFIEALFYNNIKVAVVYVVQHIASVVIDTLRVHHEHAPVSLIWGYLKYAICIILQTSYAVLMRV